MAAAALVRQLVFLACGGWEFYFFQNCISGLFLLLTCILLRKLSYLYLYMQIFCRKQSRNIGHYP